MHAKPDSTTLKFCLSSDIKETSPFETNEEDGERVAMLGSRPSVEDDVERVGVDMVVKRLHQLGVV